MMQENADILKPLNPADAFTLAMDDEIRREGMPGSLCGFALVLNTAPDIGLLKARIQEFITKFPLATASLQQHGRRFYWCARNKQRAIFLQHACPPTDSEQAFHQTKLQEILNRQEPRESVSPLEFHLLDGTHRQVFLLRWIHPFCDARGADLILKYLCTDDTSQRHLFNTAEITPLVNQQLAKFSFWQKIRLFFKAKQHIENIDKLQSILPLENCRKAPEKLSYISKRLNTIQTQRIAANVRRHVGLTGTSLYYLGCMMRALQKLQPQQPGDAYCVPYAFNLRKSKALSPVLGNHVGAMFAQAPRELVQNRERLFKHLKQQNIKSIREQLDYAFLPLMWAGSWLSLEKYGKTLRQSYSSGSERSSFWFSDIGQPDLSGHTFMGAEIIDLIHLCQISSPPGLALLSCQFQGRLTLSYNFIEPLLNADWIEELHTLMVQELLAE